MALVTFQLIEGLERGRIFADLQTPITIGREEENAIQLNDERVSRFHAKVQHDDGRIILTDLDSTNGTRVNGHPVQMRVLQLGDQIAIGRCLLIYGSREQIIEHFGAEAGTASPSPSGLSDPAGQTLAASDDLKRAANSADAHKDPSSVVPVTDDNQAELFPNGPPPPPEGLRPVHRAEVSDFASYVHEQIRRILQAGCEEPTNDGQGPMKLDRLTWQRLLHLEMDLATYLRQLADPNE